jgi:S-adenosylmethionine:tRNA ribosyltransferase-isomerase
MKRQDFSFELPKSLIAQYPLDKRSDSRLLKYDRTSAEYNHHQFKSIADLLSPGDLLVMNDSRVIPARFYGTKETGGKVEFLIERVIDEHTFWSHIKSSKAPKPGALIHLEKGWVVSIVERDDDLFLCSVVGQLDEMLHQVGHMPLPPYIERQDETLDQSRYQTVFARHNGSVAAPTAGLHFDEEVMEQLKEKGIDIAYSTLHVGAGTFRPLRCDDITDHKMHSEYFTISDALANAVNQAKADGRRVIAVGTTALRSLESAADSGKIKPCSRDTDIFIYPGYEFKVIDGLITNFHLPESTLLMLVAAFIGYEPMMEFYRIAIENQYRFFSYGDACLLL